MPSDGKGRGTACWHWGSVAAVRMAVYAAILTTARVFAGAAVSL
ncbi:hypothetical protein PRJ_1481 [Pseudomonas sp. XWY-1]|nr:hypothetical protein PRJ_1481 [Pseudomonas sp. XWY-1]